VRAVVYNECKVGVSLLYLDNLIAKIADENGCTCGCYQYEGFPRYNCISLNDELIHGVPDKRTLKEGDMVTFDIVIAYEKHFCDAAFTIIIGKNEIAERILNTTINCLNEAIKLATPEHCVGDISYCIEKIAAESGYTVIKDFGGHGCGNKMHEDPFVACYGEAGTGPKLVKNMVICIEPMLMTGSDQYYIDPKNGWTVKSKNKELTCQCEHMLLITDGECEILTL
jgi:methionyl aminopeptidase